MEEGVLVGEKSYAKVLRQGSTYMFQELSEDQYGQSYLGNGLEETHLL